MNRRPSSPALVGESLKPLAYQPTSPATPMLVHQLSDDPLVRQRDLKSLMGEIAQNLRKHARTSRERSICDDVRRGLRLSLDGLEILCELAARSEKPFILEEAIRGEVLRALAQPSRCPIDTFIDETRAQAQADVAQAGFLVERTSSRRDAALDGLGQHFSKIRVALDALHVWGSRRLA